MIVGEGIEGVIRDGKIQEGSGRKPFTHKDKESEVVCVHMQTASKSFNSNPQRLFSAYGASSQGYNQPRKVVQR